MPNARTDPTYIEPVEANRRKALWIEIRDSSTGERQVRVYAAPVPRNRSERERFLNRDVPAIFPGAKLRTFAGGTATFIRDPLLITAHYGAVGEAVELLPVEERLPEPVVSRAGQGSLFAA